MSLSKATDEQILQIIEEHGAVEDSPNAYHSTLGNTFYVVVHAGEDSPKRGKPPTAKPPEKLAHLSDYQELQIELYYLKPMPPKEELKMDPIEFEFDDKKYKFEFDLKCFPHIAINPINNNQFKSQPWAQGFQSGPALGYSKKVDPHTLCDILRYCDRMARLKLFW